MANSQASMTYKKIHLKVGGERTTININIYLTALFIRKKTGEKVDPIRLSDTNVSTARELIQREINIKNGDERRVVYLKRRLKERVEEFLINEIADPNLLS